MKKFCETAENNGAVPKKGNLMKKNLLIAGVAMLLVCLLVLAAVFLTREKATTSPVNEYESLEQAETDLGYTGGTPQYLPTGYEPQHLSVVNDDILQVIYQNADGKSIIFRSSLRQDDITGDSNNYEYSGNMEWEGLKIAIRGNQGHLIDGAVWVQDGVQYSLRFEVGVADQELEWILDEME